MKRGIRTVQVGEVELYTEYKGSPSDPVCLLLAGACASAHFWSDAFCDLLVAHHFFVIRYDQRDSGSSSSTDWERKPYDLFDLARDALAVLDAYHSIQAHLVGHSMGGYVAQALALTAPKRILSMSLLSAGPLASVKEVPLTPVEERIKEETWRVLLSRREGEGFEETLQGFLPIWSYLHGTFPMDIEIAETYTRDLLLRSARPLRAGNPHEKVMAALAHISHTPSAECASSQRECEKYGLDRKGRQGALGGIDIPTLVVHGEEDPLVLPREGKSLSIAIPHAELVMIPGMGHLFFHRELERKLGEVVSEHMHATPRKILEHNLYLHMTYFAGRVPGVEVDQDREVNLITTRIADEMFNYAVGAHFSIENVLPRIEEVASHFRERKLAFSWWVSEGDTPAPLQVFLEKSGFVCRAQEKGMLRSVGGEKGDIFKGTSLLVIRRVEDYEGVRAFARVIAQLEGCRDYYDDFYGKIPLSALEEGASLEMYVGFVEEKAVTTGVLVSGGNCAGIYYLVTIPEARGRGYASRMMEYLLASAKQKGYFLVGLEASSQGERLYARLGFKEVALFYEYAREG